MIDTKAMRAKYTPRPDANGKPWRPAGSSDVLGLCDTVDQLLHIVRTAQALIPDSDGQNQIEALLWRLP